MKGLQADARWGGTPRGGPEPREFGRLFDSVLAELDQYFWLLDLQSGPFSITAEPDFARLERELERYWLDVPDLAGIGLWRPGVLSRFGRFLVEDEQSHMLGFPGPEAKALGAVARLPGLGRLDHAFFTGLKAVAPVFITTRAAEERPLLRWEIYSTNENCLERLLQDPRWTPIHSPTRPLPLAGER